MAAFKSASAALDYARAVQGNTGHPQVACPRRHHIGTLRVEEGDVFGGTVNFAARCREPSRRGICSASGRRRTLTGWGLGSTRAEVGTA